MTIDNVEAEIQNAQKLDSNALIQSLLFMPNTTKCQLLIPLCRMVALPLVRPVLQSDIRDWNKTFGQVIEEETAVSTSRQQMIRELLWM